jgi:hypothetical protein
MVRPVAALCGNTGAIPRGDEERGCVYYQTKVHITSLVADDEATGRGHAKVDDGAMSVLSKKMLAMYEDCLAGP